MYIQCSLQNILVDQIWPMGHNLVTVGSNLPLGLGSLPASLSHHQLHALAPQVLPEASCFPQMTGFPRLRLMSLFLLTPW